MAIGINLRDEGDYRPPYRGPQINYCELTGEEVDTIIELIQLVQRVEDLTDYEEDLLVKLHNYKMGKL